MPLVIGSRVDEASGEFSWLESVLSSEPGHCSLSDVNGLWPVKSLSHSSQRFCFRTNGQKPEELADPNLPGKYLLKGGVGGGGCAAYEAVTVK